MKYLFIAVAIVSAIFFWQRNKSPTQADYTLEYSEGECSETAECSWAGNGCGGGHGACTSNPEKFPDDPNNCDTNMEFPFNKNYTCGCIKSLGKCGWVK